MEGCMAGQKSHILFFVWRGSNNLFCPNIYLSSVWTFPWFAFGCIILHHCLFHFLQIRKLTSSAFPIVHHLRRDGGARSEVWFVTPETVNNNQAWQIQSSEQAKKWSQGDKERVSVAGRKTNRGRKMAVHLCSAYYFPGSLCVVGLPLLSGFFYWCRWGCRSQSIRSYLTGVSHYCNFATICTSTKNTCSR